jgi:hypothetical protein
MGHPPYIRDKAIQLRTEHNMALEQIVERLQIPKTTVYGWIRDIPIPRTNRQTEAQRKGTEAMRAKAAALREEAYQQGVAEAPELLKDQSLRDFVVLYMAEGTKRNRNTVSIVNSDVAIMKLSHRWMKHFAKRRFFYGLQYHADQDVDELKLYWSEYLDLLPSEIKEMRKSNSNQLSGRHFRSVYGLLTVQANDTYFRSRLQAWMDYVKSQW